MEILAFIAVCYVVWKIFDSNSSKTTVKRHATRRVTITDGPKGKTIVTETKETIDQFDEIKSTKTNHSTFRNINSYQQEPIRSISDSSSPRVRVVRDDSASNELTLETKKCNQCARYLPRSMFYSFGRGELSDLCKICKPTRQAQIERKEAETSGYKSCPKCKKRRRRSSFGNSKKNLDGLTVWCLSCLGQLNKTRRNKPKK